VGAGIPALQGADADGGGGDDAIRVTHLATAEVVDDRVSRDGPGAATAREHIGRFRELAEAGVQMPIVTPGAAGGAEAVARFAPVVAAFAG
jgi:hypothetical protein